MSLSIGHLGPPGTYAEEAALAYANWLSQTTQQESFLCPCSTIAETLRTTASGQVHVAVVPVENSIEGSVTVTLDTLWQLDNLQIQQALVLPIVHALVSRATDLAMIETVYSHPQPLGQCQKWLEQFLPQVQLIPTNSTTEAFQYLKTDLTVAAIASRRAAQLYHLPVLVSPIQDHPDNCTRFWVLDRSRSQTYPYKTSSGNTYTSLGFSVPANIPGALVKPLQIFADRHINLSRIESRPTKRSLGDYVFFIDLEANLEEPSVQSALAELATYTEVLKIFGSYTMLQIGPE
jgi:prephenate dehydratase